MDNRLNQTLAGLGVVFIAVLLDIILIGISEDMKGMGFVIVVAFEWVYICYLQNKGRLTFKNCNFTVIKDKEK